MSEIIRRINVEYTIKAKFIRGRATFKSHLKRTRAHARRHVSNAKPFGIGNAYNTRSRPTRARPPFARTRSVYRAPRRWTTYFVRIFYFFALIFFFYRYEKLPASIADGRKTCSFKCQLMKVYGSFFFVCPQIARKHQTRERSRSRSKYARTQCVTQVTA